MKKAMASEKRREEGNVRKKIKGGLQEISIKDACETNEHSG